MQRTPFRSPIAAGLLVAIVVAACGGAAVTPVPTGAAPGSAAPVVTNAPVATNVSTGPPSVNAPSAVEAGSSISVEWTGPNAEHDFVTIVVKGMAAWTDEDYFYTTEGSPANLTAPSTAGAYEIWYVSGADRKVLARQDITLTPFTGGLQAAESVMADTEFDVTWAGPNGPGDYVTIVKAGTAQWTNEDYFYTTDGSPSKLLAPVEPGSYEIWYVIGSDRTIQARRAITVTAATATLQAPESVAKSTMFDVTWTGPNGPGDFVTIVAVGAPPEAYGQYFSTSAGSPQKLLAPDTSGTYEIRYVAGQKDVVFATIQIKVN